MTVKFEKMMAESKERKERNDCAVKALAIALDVPYAKAWEALNEAGRKPRGGTYWGDTLKAVETLGGSLKEIPRPAKTVKTLPAKVDPGKTYLVRVVRHVLAVTDGAVDDWTAGRAKRVKEIYEVTKPFISKASPVGVMSQGLLFV
jgi:hypothetical protein